MAKKLRIGFGFGETVARSKDQVRMPSRWRRFEL